MNNVRVVSHFWRVRSEYEGRLSAGEREGLL